MKTVYVKNAALFFSAVDPKLQRAAGAAGKIFLTKPRRSVPIKKR
jgi:hypothetical protein